MKCRSPIAFALAASLLLFTASLPAQDTSTPAAPAAAGSPASGSSAELPSNTATLHTTTGEVTINSAPSPKPSTGVAPPFAQLSGGSKAITAAQAEAYPPLANDFDHADRNRDGTISADEYAHWIKQL